MKTRILLVGLALTYTASAQKTQQPSLRWLSRALEQLVAQVSPSVVQISASGLVGRNSDDAGTGRVQRERESGSGVIVDPEGFIITNAHVINTSTRIQVLLPDRETEKKYRSILKPPGKIVDAELVGMDRETDLAVLKVPVSGLPALKIGDSGALRQGEVVMAAGSPFGLQNTVTMGIVSAVARQVRPDDPMIYIQTDASINPGNSGGPLLNTEGEVVGINTFILSESGGNVGVGFAAPSAIVRNVYEQIRKYGRVRRGEAGLILQTIDPELSSALSLPAQTGVVVADVVPGGSAAAAGIEVKDVIVALDGKPIENARQFDVNVYGKADQTITLDLLRGGEKKSIQVAVLERPRDPDRLMSLVNKDENLVPQLGLLAVNIDEKITAMLPPLRKLSGAVIVAVLGDGQAAAAGLRAGDVVYEVNNRPVQSLKDLIQAADENKAGKPLVLQVERGGKLQFVLIDTN